MTDQPTPTPEDLLAGPTAPEPTPAQLIAYVQSLERNIQHQAGKIRLLHGVLMDEKAARRRAERIVDILLVDREDPTA